MNKPAIFISYSTNDQKQAEAIHQQLTSACFDVWRDKTRLETDWSREIAVALSQCDLLCLVWSENAAQSKWVKHEWLTARALEKYIIICRLSGAPSFPEPLHNLHAVKFDPFEDGLYELVKRIKDKQEFREKYEYKILPSNSFIPFNPNPEFTGRENDLLELYLKMIGNLNKIGINQIGTVGMGGIGKTQLVVEFAFRYSFAFHSVHWIQAAKYRDWISEFVNLAKNELQLQIANPEGPDANKQYIYALRNHFKAHPNTLVVMDNVEEPGLLNNDLLFGLTPLSLGCDLLFTTRSQFTIPGVVGYSINILSPEAAYALLTIYRKPFNQTEKEHAEAILNAVGYLPLAIILIGAYLREYESDISFADYHEELQKNKLDTIDIGNASPESLATRHIAAVTTTLESQWKMLQDEDAKYLFKLAGQLGEAEIISKARLELLSGIDGGKNTIIKPLAKAFNLLQKLNLMERLEGDLNSIRLHPLIHAFARKQVKEHQQSAFKARAARNLKQSYFQYFRLEQEIINRGIHQVEDDLQIAIDWWDRENQKRQELILLQRALMLSSNQLIKDSNQLASQLLGRLQNQKLSGITALLKQAINEKKGVWLRPMTTSLISPGNLLRTFEGHSSGVMSIAIHPDGMRVVSGSTDETLKVWDLKKGTIIHTLEGHRESVIAVAIHPNGQQVISASADSVLKIWNLETGEEITQLNWHRESVIAISIHPDGQQVIFVSVDGSLNVWDPEKELVIPTMEGQNGEVNSVAIHPNGQKVVFAYTNRKLKILDLETNEVLHTLEENSNNIHALAIHPDGKKFISGSWHGVVKVWDLEKGTEIKSYKVHTDGITAIAIHPNGRQVISAFVDGYLKVLDLQKGEVIHTLKGHSVDIKALLFHPDGNKVISASLDAIVKVWDLELSTVINISAGHSDPVTALAIHPDGKRVISASMDRIVKVWSLKTGKLIQNLEGHQFGVIALAIHPNGRQVVSGYWNGIVKVWDLGKGMEIRSFKVHDDGVMVIAIHPNGKEAISASMDGTVKVWDLKKGTIIHTLKGHNADIKALAIHANGQQVSSASLDGIVKVWDWETGREIHILEGHGGSAITVAMHPDGNKGAIAFLNGAVKFWNLETDTEMRTLNDYNDDFKAVAVHLDNKWVISGSWDGVLKVWDLEKGEEIYMLEGHNDHIIVVEINSDVKKGVSSSTDRSLIFWDLKTEINQASFFGDNYITHVSFEPIQNIIVAGDDYGNIHFLKIEGIEEDIPTY